MSELRRCPFCGRTIKKISMYGGITGFQCMTCGAIVSFGGAEKEEDACRRFNNRHPDFVEVAP